MAMLNRGCQFIHMHKSLKLETFPVHSLLGKEASVPSAVTWTRNASAPW